MRKIKQIMAMVLVLVLTFTVFQPVSAAALTEEEKAQFLNDLTILRGDGSGFNLDGQLKRSEAATFIVRMMGKDDIVSNNPQNYMRSTFSDVTDLDWFSPYVGYCVQEGIVGGFEDGTFKPNAYVSEKAFLKMLMTAMDYTYNDDFGWNDVYSFAYELGLVTDMSYTTKVDDNTSYTRGDVVAALYDTMKATKKASDEKMIQFFLDSGIIDEGAAVTAGILEDSIDTALEEVQVFNETTIILTFNEVLKNVSLDDFIIYENNDTNQQVELVELIKGTDGKTYTILMKEAQEPDRKYGVLMDELEDSYGNTSEILNGSFTGYRPDVIESNYFRISKAEAVNSKTVHIYFTHPLNENMLQPNLYTLKQGETVLSSAGDTEITVGLMGSNDSVVVITLDKGSFQGETEYEMIISGDATSQYGVRLLDGEGDLVLFNGVEKDEEPLKLLLANGPNSTTVELYFNKTLNETIAEQVFSYYLTTDKDVPIQITKATLNADGDTVNLTVGTTLKDETEYKLLINRVVDATSQYEIELASYTFTNNFNSTSDVTITSVSTEDANTIVVGLSRALDEESARNTVHYNIDGVGNTYNEKPSAIFYDHRVDPLELKIFLGDNDDLSDDKEYEVELLTGLYDANGRKQDGKQNKSFKYNHTKTFEIYIDEAVVVGASTVRLTFNKEIALEVPNVLNTNYAMLYEDGGVEYKLIPISANYIDPYTMILHFTSMDPTIDYTVTFEELASYSGLKTVNTGDQHTEEVVRD